MFKFLNQCFARLRFWKSVSDSRNLLDGATAVLLETLFQNPSRGKHWFKNLNIISIATFDQVPFGVCVWCNLAQSIFNFKNHNYFYSMQLIFYYIRRKKNEFQCSSIGVGNWSLIKNIFLVFSSSSSIFFQKISSNRRTHYGNTGYGVSNSGNTQLESYLPKNQHTQRKLLNLENWTNGESQ